MRSPGRQGSAGVSEVPVGQRIVSSSRGDDVTKTSVPRRYAVDEKTQVVTNELNDGYRPALLIERLSLSS